LFECANYFYLIAQNQTPKETDLSYRTFPRTLKLLETRGIKNLIRTEPCKKGGKEKKIYGKQFDLRIFKEINWLK
jgi:hypothetical protein